MPWGGGCSWPRRRRRPELGRSQGRLADELVVSRQTVLSPEKGRSDPGLPLTFRIAALFRCRIEDVVTPGVDGGQRA
ncbi:helix-turn-helix transcriptional regulator [Pseudonocardia bannensis]|uniref:Helix-turn-helix domain-containing protein n=1 Tax=Pseudonocardia bannensis TaxID=630973 RepID=A0A848DL98_9PSEU|nr:helix-turn-helix domain-containing protein [Pseudonocardia bannensis]NMH93335.1 helix-turn-helix domain-containing protein [Pseudonocardia bannensis]